MCYIIDMKYALFLTTLFLTAVILERTLLPIRTERNELSVKYDRLKGEIDQRRQEKKALEEVLMSQDDLDWQTLTLIRVLGVVPEGSKKVIFK